MKTSATLYYAHDPMCSWCWGFTPVYRQLIEQLPAQVKTERLLGGLAADSEVPMTDDMQAMLQNIWRGIQQKIPGTEFNFNFWTKCTPRRSTWPACRAVIAARMQGDEYDQKMTLAIQTAYYLEARNPSDDSTLIELAEQLGLDVEMFRQTLNSSLSKEIFEQERSSSAHLGINGFPSLVLRISRSAWRLPVDYNSAEPMLTLIDRLLTENSPG